MKYVRFALDGVPAWGISEGASIRTVEGDPVSGCRPTDQLLDAAAVRLLAPATPGKIVGIGLNYAAHAAESGKPLPEEPLMFLKPPTSLIGPMDAIVVPNLDHRTDHEAELAIVIGRRCRNLTADTWRDAVLGYTCANDVSDRVLQRRDGQFTRGKGFDTFCPLGPALVTDLDPSDIAITCTLNGQRRQHSRTSDLIFDVEQILIFVSRVMTLEPWDVILTGTPEGVGPMTPGDVVEIDIEGIGVLVNQVRAEREGMPA